MKKKYVRPVCEAIYLDTEGPILSGSEQLTIDSSKETPRLFSGRRTGWDSSLWTDTGEDE